MNLILNFQQNIYFFKYFFNLINYQKNYLLKLYNNAILNNIEYSKLILNLNLFILKFQKNS